MSTMNKVIVLMVCLTINILEIRSECVPEQLTDFQPEKLDGTWRLVLMHENYTYFQHNINNIVEKMQYQEDKYENYIGVYNGNISYLENDEEQEMDGEWEVSPTAVYPRIGDLGDKVVDGFRINATDYATYYVRTATYLASFEQNADIAEVLIREEKCDDEKAMKAAKEAITKLCLNPDEFEEDKNKKCSP